MSEITIATADGGSFAAYLALPARLPAPAVICLQEVYGVNRFMRAITDFWAAQGFIAISPDLYWRMRPGIELDPEVEGARDQALALGGELDRPQAVEDVAAAVAHLRGMEECTGRVATTGYCLGGLLAYLIGTRHDADCNVSYYGVGIEAFLNEADRLSHPIMLHVGEEDPWTPAAVRVQLAAAFADNPLATVHLYPGVGHAFARPGASTHVPATADLANYRTAAFFRAHLF